MTRGTFCGGLDFRPCLLSQRRDFLRRLRVEDAGRDFRRGEEAGPGLPAPEAWGVRLPGLGAASGPGRLGVLHVRIGPGAPWLGTHGRQRTARLALRGGGVTGECRPAIFRPGPAALVCAAAASRRAGLVCVLRGWGLLGPNLKLGSVPTGHLGNMAGRSRLRSVAQLPQSLIMQI